MNQLKLSIHPFMQDKQTSQVKNNKKIKQADG